MSGLSIAKRWSRRPLFHLSTSLVTTSLLVCHAHAENVGASEEPGKALEEMVVVASRVPTPLSSLGVSVDTIDRDTLELLGYNSLADVLDLRTGVSVTQDGGMGKVANVRIRGEEGFRTRILLDGIDIADPSSPQISPRLEHLLSEGVQQVEILRGPQGLMYGADAGGVIAITSRQPSSGVTGDLSVEGGSDAFGRVGSTLAGGSDRARFAATATRAGTDGFNARDIDATDPDDDGYDNTTFHGTASIDLNDHWSVGASAHRVKGDNDYDGCFDMTTFSVAHNCTDDYEQTAWRAFAAWRNDMASAELSYEESDIERGFFTAGVESFGTEGKQQEVSLLTNLHLKSGQRLTAGFDAAEQRFDDNGRDRSRDNLGLYAEYQMDIGTGSLSAGVRHDDNDDFGQHTSWRVSAIQKIAEPGQPLFIKAAIGTGFRAPSLYEIAYNNGPFTFPPASTTELEEEKSRGWEIGLQWGETGRQLAVTWFDQRIENEIYFDLMSYSGYLQRDGESESTGLELSGETGLGHGFAVNANITWNDTEDYAGVQRPYRPELTGAATLSWQNESIRTALTGRVAQDAVSPYGEDMADYALLDWSAVIDLGKGVSANARVENLTGRDYQQVQSYNGAGRRWFVGLRYSF